MYVYGTNFYASFYLKHVMNMSLFKILNEVWFVKLHRDIVHHEENNRDKMSLVLVIKIYVCSNSNWRELRVVLHKPSLKRRS